MTSRLMSEAFMPSVPMLMPSVTAMVLNSSGVPPAARMPAFTRSARRRRWKLQGPISVQVLAMPISGFERSSSVRPVALEHGACRGAVVAVQKHAAVFAHVVFVGH